MHKGTRAWCEQLQRAPATTTLAEFDATDCFLNTPRELVQQALQYWLRCFRGSQRDGPLSAINREGKAGDHWGKPFSIHYWQLWGQQVETAVGWELERNSLFEVTAEYGKIVLDQVRGLPISGHFSAALVELVALHRWS